jgi:uncharacterized coiled-coil protein SlyX
MRVVVSLSGADLKMTESESKISVNFVLAVLRQHEIEFDRLIDQLEMLVNKVNELTEKIQNKLI